ncbi:MAG: transcription factor S [Thermoplasmatota archaeon]
MRGEVILASVPMFCPNCKALLRPSGGVLACARCGTTVQPGGGPSLVVKQKATEDPTKSVVVDMEKDKIDLLPTADVQCEKCGNGKAYYFFRQTRAADEATTRFFECTKCNYRWRDYR